MSEKPYIVFRWREWLWALRWRLLLWSVIGVCLAGTGFHSGNSRWILAGIALSPVFLMLALLAQGILGLSYILPERTPKVWKTGEIILSCYALLAFFALMFHRDVPELVLSLVVLTYAILIFTLAVLLPKEPPERRPVLHHPLHQAEPSPPFEDGRNIAERLPAADPVWGWLAIAALAAVVAFLNYWPLL